MCFVLGITFAVMCIGSTVQGSAIPMWEYLERTEKINLLYSMFEKQVSAYCDSVEMPDETDCQKAFLFYGLTNLAKMSEDSLDKMDPYQRGATGIIWESMMKGSYKMENPEIHKSHHNAGENKTGSGINKLGSHVEASSNVPQYTITENKKYVAGPMIVRVLPNGRPVPGEQQLPEDEDAEDLKLMSVHPPPEIVNFGAESNYQQRSHKTISINSGVSTE